MLCCSRAEAQVVSGKSNIETRVLDFQQKIGVFGDFHSHEATPIAGWFLETGKSESKVDDDWG